MQCRYCRLGATLNGKWREAIVKTPVPHNAITFLDRADEAHELCTGCTCQHATGEDSLKVLPQL